MQIRMNENNRFAAVQPGHQFIEVAVAEIGSLGAPNRHLTTGGFMKWWACGPFASGSATELGRYGSRAVNPFAYRAESERRRLRLLFHDGRIANWRPSR